MGETAKKRFFERAEWLCLPRSAPECSAGFGGSVQVPHALAVDFWGPFGHHSGAMSQDFSGNVELMAARRKACRVWSALNALSKKLTETHFLSWWTLNFLEKHVSGKYKVHICFWPVNLGSEERVQTKTGFEPVASPKHECHGSTNYLGLQVCDALQQSEFFLPGLVDFEWPQKVT